MPTLNGFKDIEFGGPAVYRIVIQGALGASWSDRLSGMAITAVDRGERPPHTVLYGSIRDQAQLSGVLDTLYNLHLSILRVEKVDDEKSTANNLRRGGR